MGLIPLLTDCDPGFEPTEFNVIIAPEVMETKRNGLIIPEMAKEKADAASMRGLLVAVSPVAFDFANWPVNAKKPQVGDTVLFAKYAGTLFDGRDTVPDAVTGQPKAREYRVIKDKDIIAIAS